MTRPLPIDPGPPLRDSGWGSAKLNTVSWSRSVRMTVHADGWLLTTMVIFGGGQLWLPREGTTVTDVPVRFGRHRRILQNDVVTVVLYGRLADVA